MKNKTFTEVMDKFTHTQDSRQNYEKKWNTLYDMFRFKKKKERPGRANFYIPHAFSNVETVYPRLTAKTPRTRIMPVGPEDQKPAVVMSKLIDYAWDKLSLDDVVRRWVKGTLIYGTGITKVTWKTDRKKIKKEIPQLDNDGNFIENKTVTEERVVYDDPIVSNIDLRDIYLDMDGVDERSCKFIIHRYWATKEELKENPNYSNIKNVQFGAENEHIRRGLSSQEKRDADEKNIAEVLEYWEDDRLVVIAGGKVLRDDPNPYECKKKPFVIMVDQIDDQVAYGIGEVEPIEGLQSEMNTLRNQRMDFNNLILNPTFKVMPGSVTDLDNVQFKPGHKIMMNSPDPSAISPVEMPSAPFSSYKEEESIRVDLQTITGVSDYSRGTEATKMNDTATGISLIQQAANERFNAKARNMESALGRMTELLKDLYQQYITTEKVFRITEEETEYFLKVQPKDIRGNFDIRVESGSTIPSNKMQERSEEMNKYNVLMANPLINESPGATLEVTRSLLEAWEDPKKDKILEALEEQVSEADKQKDEAEEKQALEEQEQRLEKEISEELAIQRPGKGEESGGEQTQPIS